MLCVFYHNLRQKQDRKPRNKPTIYGQLINYKEGKTTQWRKESSSISGSGKTALVAQLVKASAYNAGDLGLIPGSGKSLEKEMATHSSILAWEIPWTEEPGGLWSIGLQKSQNTT